MSEKQTNFGLMVSRFLDPNQTSNSSKSRVIVMIFFIFVGIIWPSICLYSSLEILMNGAASQGPPPSPPIFFKMAFWALLCCVKHYVIISKKHETTVFFFLEWWPKDVINYYLYLNKASFLWRMSNYSNNIFLKAKNSEE